MNTNIFLTCPLALTCNLILLSNLFPLPSKFCSFHLPSSLNYPISLLQAFYPFCHLSPQRSLQNFHLLLPCVPFLYNPSLTHSFTLFLAPLSPSAPFFPKTLSCPSLPLTFSPCTLFPASQLAFIFPRLDYGKALPVCQHS